MTVEPGANDLTTVAAVQAYLSLATDQDSDLLQSLVTAASAFIQGELGYNIAVSTYTETRSGNGRNLLMLANRPVTGITSVSIGNNAVSASPGYGQAGYDFDEESIYLTGMAFLAGLRNVFITYTAGYATTPADLAQACNELVALRYKLRDKTGLTSEAAMQQTTGYSQRDVPASVQTVIDRYRRVFYAG